MAINIQFAEKKLIGRSYIIAKALSTSKKVKLNNTKKYAIITWNINTEIFMVYVIALDIKIKVIDSLNKIIILVEYLNSANIFLLKFVAKLLKHSNNDYIIKLEENK